MAADIRAADVRAALETRHPEDEGEWVVLHEALRIDTLAIRCWGGRKGYRRIAYEIKVSKSDFDGEIRRPWKRERACEISDQFYFAMPWMLAQRCLPEIPAGLGLIGVVQTPGGFVAREITRAKATEARVLNAEELSTLVRWRSQPPALRNALIERAQRNEDVRRIRNQLAVATKALAEMAIRQVRPGVELRPPWSDYGVVVLSEPVLERGRVKVQVRRAISDIILGESGGKAEGHEEDLGYLLGMGYEIVPAEDEGIAA